MFTRHVIDEAERLYNSMKAARDFGADCDMSHFSEEAKLELLRRYYEALGIMPLKDWYGYYERVPDTPTA